MKRFYFVRRLQEERSAGLSSKLRPACLALLTAVLTLGLNACSDDNPPQPAEKQSITVSIDEVDYPAGNDLTWQRGDKIKVFKNVAGSCELVGIFEAESEGLSVAFSSSTAKTVKAGESYVAAFPASAFTDDNTPIVAVAQTQNAADNRAHQKKYTLIGTPVPVTPGSNGSLRLDFSTIHTSFFEFNIVNTDAADNQVQLQKIVLEDATEGNASFQGPDASFLSSVSLTIENPGLLPAGNPAGQYWLTAICNATETTPLTVSLHTDKGIRTFDLEVPEPGYEAGSLYTINLDWKEGKDDSGEVVGPTQTATLPDGNINMPTGGGLELYADPGDPSEGNELDKAFDHDLTTDLEVATNQFEIVWSGTSPKALNYYAIVSSAAGDTQADPKKWAFYGSQDKESWMLLDEQADQTFTGRGQRKGFKFENDVEFTYYKLRIDDNNGGSSTRIAEVLTSTPYVVEVTQEKTKFLTSGTVTVEFSNMVSGQYFENAIDDNQNNAWAIDHTKFFIIWEPDAPICAQSYTIRSSPGKAGGGYPKENDPKVWKFYGSDDGEAWTLLDEQDHEYVGGGGIGDRRNPKKCDLTNTAFYSYYKWEIEANRGGTGYTCWGEMAIAGKREAREPVIPTTFEEVYDRRSNTFDVSTSPLGAQAGENVAWLDNGKVTAEEMEWLRDPYAEMVTYRPAEFPNWVWKTVANKNNIVLYPYGEPSPADVNQHSISDCSMLAAFASLAYIYPDFIQSIITQNEPDANGNISFDVKMFDPKGDPIVVTVGDRFLAGADGAWKCVTGKNNKITWATVMEKAIMKWNLVYRRKKDVMVYGISAIAGLAPFTGSGEGFAFGRGRLLPEEAEAAIKILLEKGYIVTNEFGKVLPMQGGQSVMLHTFSVMNSNREDAFFQIRNPWGFTNGHPNGDGILYIMDFTNNQGVTSTAKDITDIMNFRVASPGAANPGFAKPGVTTPYTPRTVGRSGGDNGIRMDEYLQRMANDGRLIND